MTGSAQQKRSELLNQPELSLKSLLQQNWVRGSVLGFFSEGSAVQMKKRIRQQ